MTTIDWMLLPLRKYATFTGRAPRSEFWWFVVLLLIVGFFAGGIDISIFGLRWLSSRSMMGPSATLISLATIIPSIAVSVRRLHDLDKSGWWYLLGLVPLIGALILLVWFASAGSNGPNRFGPDPL